MNPTCTLKNIQSQLKHIIPQNISKSQNDNDAGSHQVESGNKVGAEDVEKSLQNLRNQLQEIQKLTYVPKQDNHYKISDITNNLGLLNPFEQADLKQDSKTQGQKEHEIQSIEELMASNKSAKEKVEFLRKNPEMLQEFMRKQEETKREQAKKAKEDAFKARLKHQAEMTAIARQSNPHYQPVPLTKNYLAKERKLLKDGYYKPINQLIRSKFKTAKLEFKQMEVAREIQLRQIKKYKDFQKKQAKEEAVQSILPVTYISQRNKLLTFIQLTSNLALLRDVSSVYSKINAVNMSYVNNCTKIQQYFRMFQLNYRFRCQTQCLAKIQILAKHWINKKRYDERIYCLQRAKQLLFYQYNSNAFLGTVLNFNNKLNIILTHLRVNQEKKWARKKIFTDMLTQIDIEVTSTSLKQQEMKRRNLENANSKDPKKKKKVYTIDEIDIPEDLVEEMRLTSKTVVFNEVVEIIYQKLLAEKRQILIEQNENKFEDFNSAIFMLTPETCRVLLKKVKEIGSDVDDNGTEWIQRNDFVDYIGTVDLSAGLEEEQQGAE